MRPQLAAHYDGADLIRQATLLAIGISQAFLAGNRRSAFAAADVFVRGNGCVFAGDPVQFAKRLKGVAEQTDDRLEVEDRFEAFLRGRTTCS